MNVKVKLAGGSWEDDTCIWKGSTTLGILPNGTTLTLKNRDSLERYLISACTVELGKECR